MSRTRVWKIITTQVFRCAWGVALWMLIMSLSTALIHTEVSRNICLPLPSATACVRPVTLEILWLFICLINVVDTPGSALEFGAFICLLKMNCDLFGDTFTFHGEPASRPILGFFTKVLAVLCRSDWQIWTCLYGGSVKDQHLRMLVLAPRSLHRASSIAVGSVSLAGFWI